LHCIQIQESRFFKKLLMDLHRSLAPFAIASVLWSAPFTVFAQPASVIGSVEEVRAVSTDIAANDDGSFVVAERVQYAIPVAGSALIAEIDMHPAGGSTASAISVEDVSVQTAEGAPLTFTASETADGSALRVTIDDRAAMVVGVHDLLVSYVVRGAIERSGDARTLRWRAVSSWHAPEGDAIVPIRRASVTVRVPTSAAGGVTSHACKSGEVDGPMYDCLVQTRGGTVFFAGNGPMAVDVGWTSGATTGGSTDRNDYAKYYPHAAVLTVIALLYAKFRRRA